VDDLVAFVQQQLLDDRGLDATFRAAVRRASARRAAAIRGGWIGPHPTWLGTDFEKQDTLLSEAIDAYQAGTEPSGGERLRQLAFEAYGMYEDYREEWRPTLREEDAIVSRPGSGVPARQVPDTPRDALAELDELRERVDRLERLLAVHVPARPRAR
jgi:hypothetical protein